MSLSNEEVGRRWLEACADAELEPGREAHVALIIDAMPQRVNLAIHFHPGTLVHADDRFPLSPGQREHFNKPEIRDTHRIAVSARVEPRLMSGLLRHELQHARQYRAHPETYSVTDLANVALGEAYGPRPGGGVLYNAEPLEEDANAAASRFLRQLDGEPSRAELDGDQAQLFRAHDLPWTEEDLPAETLAFLALHPDQLEAIVAQRNGDLAAILAPLHPRAGDLWQRLHADAALQTARAEFPALVPTDDEIAAAGARAGDAWQPLARAMVAARGRAREVIHAGT